MPSIKRVAERLPMKMDLHGELMPGQLLVEVFGFGRVLVENHCGVIKYEAGEICVKSKLGILHITGNQMQLARMTREQLIITGDIECVKLEKRECK